MAQPNPHSYTAPRQLAQPGRNLFLDRSEKGPHAQRLLISAGTPTAPACLSVPLRALGIALQLDLHPSRSQCSSGQDRRQTAGSRSLTEYVTIISNVSTKLKTQISAHTGDDNVVGEPTLTKDDGEPCPEPW